MGAAAADFVTHSFTIEHMIERFDALYRGETRRHGTHSF